MLFEHHAVGTGETGYAGTRNPRQHVGEMLPLRIRPI
ncbi:hypothetical protein BJY18_005710 [Amycolatopsis jiangsuensis]|uniref:Uncharacterized protein n=1 Tax=Amycolatopsis jiangsuensis TaxID=1181879 RepID=A0A840J3N5_9PSEU|nr:hypothetical protein [Amycolatopsis jiangsuensis]